MLQRLFLGFAPTQPQREQLLQLQQSLVPRLNPDAKAVSASDLHLTLAFLGMVSESQLQPLMQLIDTLALPAFQQPLTAVDLWPKAQVCCLTDLDVNPALAKLAYQVQAVSRQLELHLSEHPFRPHISLFSKATSVTAIDKPTSLKGLALQAVTPLTLAPQQLHLYLSSCSGRAVEYRILHSWPLG